MVAELRRQVNGAGAWITAAEYSTPIYRVRANQPTVQVRVERANSCLQRAFERVPIPAGATPAPGTDRHMVIWQPTTDTMWELWLAKWGSGGWRAGYGGRIDGVSTSDGILPPVRGGATATGLLRSPAG